MFHTLNLTMEAQMATVTLNRPDVRNAFNETTIAEMTQVFQQLDADTSVRAVVLAANGAAFCAGADLNWMKKWLITRMPKIWRMRASSQRC